MEPTSRRRILRDGLLLVGGTLGAGAVAETMAPITAGAAAASTPRSFTVYGRNWSGFAADRLPGGAVQRGHRLTTEGQLLDGPDGRQIGRFYAAGFVLRHPNASDDGASSLELHTFDLDDGSIIGTGTAGSSGSVFAVIGGTGRYLGASGSYLATQHPLDQGGDGSATFVFTLVR